MAHWSGQHRKKAFFGWLAFVILAFAIGNAVGSTPISDVDQFSGESHDAEAALDRAGLRPTSEVVFLQSDKLTIKDPEFRAAVADVDAAPAAGSVRRERRVAARTAAAPSRRTATPRWSISRSPAIRSTRGIASTRCWPRWRASSPIIRAWTIEQFGSRERQQGRQRDDQRGPQERRSALDPDHADHPHHHLRHPRGGGCAAAHRDHVRDRGDGSHRAPERHPAGGRQPAGRDPADRPGRRASTTRCST